MNNLLKHKATIPVLMILAIGLLLLGFVVERKAALCVFIACWFDNLIKSIKNK